IDEITARLYANETFSTTSRIFDEEMLIAFAPLQADLSDRNLYVVQVFNKETALAAVAALTFMLIAVFSISFAVFAAGLWVLYRSILNKVNDIEISRIKHYYAKPYIIKIKADGRIKWFNRTFRQHLPASLSYKNVLDFDLTTEITEDVMNWIGQQHAFTARFQNIGRVTFIHFISLKTTGGYMLLGDDVTLDENRKDYYRTLALVHPLTELPNRNSLKWDLRIILADKDEFRRYALVAVHIAGLSKNSIGFNESVFNQTIKSTRDVLNQTLKGYDATLYHTESETFAVLIKDLGDYLQTKAWVDQTLFRFKKAIIVDANIFNIDLKLGVFEIVPENYAYLSEETCYDNMMLALNHAKQSGSINVMTYDVRMSQYATYEQVMEDDLAKAIRNDEFEMYFQPQYHFIDQRIVSFEALIRWKHPKYIQESPMTYIRLAEQNNMIIDIGKIALEKSFAVARELADEDIKISINVSPLQIVQVGFVNDLMDSFNQFGLKKHSISIEITESFLMASFDQVIPKLKALQDFGIDIHLDDFGTGYSSLQYLSELPINIIKIDKSFLVNLMTDHHKRAIVQMVSNLAKNLQIEVIVEGIEDERQMQYVIKSGCQIGQGFHISPAVPFEEAKALIKLYNKDKAPLKGLKSKSGR
ncbi:MAG: GGDEF domain-containing phosphodiesterase, partial [Acholeplasmataceae bacterium]|nr:GGDEF domain-containing phosphodiesterase [Acholeplasmataceae bacterium]